MSCARVGSTVIHLRGCTLRPCAPSDTDLGKDVNILEAALPGERDVIFASAVPPGRVRHAHLDIRLAAIVNVLDEVDISTDLILETGMTVQKYLQARSTAPIILLLVLSSRQSLAARNDDRADELQLMIHNVCVLGHDSPLCRTSHEGSVKTRPFVLHPSLTQARIGYALGVTTIKHILGIVVAVASVTVAAQATLTRTFEDEPIGRPPKGFLLAVTRDAAPDKWVVRREGGNAVLAHLADANGRRGFALAVLDGPRYGDLIVATRLKLADGDRAGGLVWQFQDSRNYYMARLDLRKQEVDLFRVVDGNRIRIERDDDLELDPNEWHTLKVIQKDEKVTVYLNGIKVFKEHDHGFRKPGGVGLWAADASGVDFDDFRAEEQGE